MSEYASIHVIMCILYDLVSAGPLAKLLGLRNAETYHPVVHFFFHCTWNFLISVKYCKWMKNNVSI